MKNKILPILCIFILASFLLIGNVFAYSESFTYNDVSYTSFIPDAVYNNLISTEEFKSGEYNYFACCSNGSASIYFFKKTDNVKFWLKSGEYPTTFSSNISDYGCVEYYCLESGANFSKKSDNSTSTRDSFYNAGNKWYFLTNVNFYTDSSCTDFFFKAPVTTLSSVLEEANPLKTFQTMMSGIIQYLIIFLVGLVAFWKAWSVLSKELRKA